MDGYFLARWNSSDGMWDIFRVFQGTPIGIDITEHIGKCRRWSAPDFRGGGPSGEVRIFARRMLYDTDHPDFLTFTNEDDPGTRQGGPAR